MSDILFVCVGNTCRSPYAEHVLRAALDGAAASGLTLASAGTRAPVGAPIDARTAALLREKGIEAPEHRASRLDAQTVRDASLVLTATREVRKRVVELHAPAVQHTFTIRQFGELLAEAFPDGRRLDPTDPTGATEPTEPAALVRGLLLAARAARTTLVARTPDEDDVVDPVDADDAVHRRAVAQMAPALGSLAAALGAAPEAPVRAAAPGADYGSAVTVRSSTRASSGALVTDPVR